MITKNPYQEAKKRIDDAAKRGSDELVLASLGLDYSKLKTLFEEVRKLTKLRHLNLHNNLIEKLPVEIFRLSQLKTLNLEVNRLVDLPSEIGQLVELQKLDLMSN